MPRRAGDARVLWVTEEAPDRSLGGGSIRQAYLFRALADAFDVDLLLAGSLMDDDVRAVAAGVRELPKRRALMTEDAVVRRALELAVTIGSPYPLPAYMAGPSRRVLTKAARVVEGRYDVICVEHEALVPVAPRNRASRWIVTLHHLLSGMIEREVAMAPGARQRWFRERDLRKARRLEAAAVSEYDRCIVCSSEDATNLSATAGGDRAEGRQRIAVIPNGVDLVRYRSVPPGREPRVLFPGMFSYAPNVDGAKWFCSEIWPRVLAEVADATLVLAGRAPTDEIRRLGLLAGVTVHADVPSMREYFEAARVVVVPLRIGTGTRLKALEAMAAGRAVVGTTHGLAGIGVRDGVEALVADEPEEFAAAVVKAFRQDDLAAALGRAGRAHVEQHFDWESIGRRFVGVISDVLESPRLSPQPRTGQADCRASTAI